jgi:signal transduction histidine kinase
MLENFGSELASGNMGKRLVRERDDEFGELSDDLNLMAARLDESIASAKSIIEFMPSMLIQLSEDGRIVRWNELANRLFEMCSEPPAGKRISETDTALAKYQEIVEKVCRSGNAELLYREKLTGFEDMLFNVHIFPMRLRHEHYAVVRIDDVTEIEHKNDQIRRAQKLESIGLLAGGIAHDFNNILSSIMGTVSLFRYRMKKRGMPSQEELERDMGIIETSSESGAAIVSLLLDIARQGKDTEFSPVNLVEIVNKIAKISSRSIDPTVEIKVSVPGEQCYVRGNNSQLQQCLLNLSVNGIQAMTTMREPGERKGGVLFIELDRITVDQYFLNTHPGSRMTDYWRISIRDTGVGMSKKVLSKIFDPFFSTKDKGAKKGTGLGLSVVYSIVHSHEGFIDVYSEVGLGSSFNLYLPVFNFDPNESVQDANREICKGSGTVLVIDDDETVRNSAQSMLEECGFTVITTTSGDEGISVLQKHPDEISLILLDLVMPGKSGGEVLKEIVAAKEGIRVIVMSGLYSKELVNELLSAGAADFIQKPFTLYSLSLKVRNVLDR